MNCHISANACKPCPSTSKVPPLDEAHALTKWMAFLSAPGTKRATLSSPAYSHPNGWWIPRRVTQRDNNEIDFFGKIMGINS